MSKIKVGIVGLPNAGKSTLFNALLKKQSALAANYPFATIEPNVGIVPVPDERLNVLADIVRTDSGSGSGITDKRPPIVPATIEFVDIAGLVAGAHKGEGLGNKFLSHIREVDVLCHVVRAFDDPDVVHTAGSVDPSRDIGIIETELILADLQTVENSRGARSGSARQKPPKGALSKEEKMRWDTIEKIKKGLNSNTPARRTILTDDERRGVRDLHLITMKPVLYVFNVSEHMFADGRQQAAGGSTTPSIYVSAKTESDLVGLSSAEQKEYMQSLGVSQSGLDQIIEKAYDMLGLISFLTMGEKEVRAWTIERGTKAPQAAAAIHTDFEKKFIKAEVVAYDELKSIGSRKKAKEKGRLRLEGKDYIVQDGDVVEFKIGA